MSASRSRSRRNVWDTLLEKGIIGIAIGLALLMAPHVLKGSALVNNIIAALQPLGWLALGLGILLIGLHLLVLYLRRGYQPQQDDEEAQVSRFQHSVLPDELLYPSARIRLEPMQQDNPPTDPHPSDSFGSSTIPAELDAPDTQPASLPPMPPGPSPTWGPEVLSQIEWLRFEALCEALMAQAGFKTRVQSHGADAGLDIWLHSRHVQGPAAVVHCRHWLRKPVSGRELREFYAAMTAHRIKRGTYITSGRYTKEALEFAQSHGINVLDGAALLALIARRRPEQQQALLGVAYEGEYWRPTCATCGTKMVERGASRSGATFWGCADYPRCRNTLRMAAAV